MATAEDLLSKILAERVAEEKAIVAERNLNLEYEINKRKIELEILTFKSELYPDNLAIQQKKLETELRLAVLLETQKQIEKSKVKEDEPRQFNLETGC